MLLDTAHTASEKEVEVIKKGGKKEKVKKPELILTYNKHMGGVDLLDAAMHHYNCARKSYYWFVRYMQFTFCKLCTTMHL